MLTEINQLLEELDSMLREDGYTESNVVIQKLNEIFREADRLVNKQ